jgi:hypothetical protein
MSRLVGKKFGLGCAGKVRYDSKAQAETAIGALNGHLRPRDGRVRAYLCQFCSGWHWGHDGKGRR